jgi:biotin operon repressor
MRAGTRVLGVSLAAFLVAAVLPAVYAQSFSVTTNKDVYGDGERVIVAGTVADAEGAPTVLVQIAKNNIQCGEQSVAVERDGSFISRPLKVDCGTGEYVVTASHLDEATSTFRIEGQAQDSEDVQELRETLLAAREKVNERIRELVGAGIPIPEQAVDKYRLGSSEASLAVQSASHGDEQQASEHRDAALAYFDETLELLSPEEVEHLSQAAQKDGERRAAEATDWLGRLGDIYRRLASLAEKNDVKDTVFAEIPMLLSDARNSLGAQNLDAVESVLAKIEPMMEHARGRLLQSAEQAAEKQSLTAAADRIESRGEKQLEASQDVPEAKTLVELALVLVQQAKSAIDDGNYSHARQLLSSASKALIEANRALQAS